MCAPLSTIVTYCYIYYGGISLALTSEQPWLNPPRLCHCCHWSQGVIAKTSLVANLPCLGVDIKCEALVSVAVDLVAIPL